MKYLLTAALLGLSIGVFSQKPRNYTDVTNDLSGKILNAPINTTPERLAVVPFVASTASLESSSQFGEYITETIIGLLSGHSQKIKLFERTRLDAVMKEQEFILTDIMKPAAALKIGQLVPIDAVLSGTYTKLKSYIDVNTRMIDVATGEIIMSFNGRIKMNKNLAALFTNGKADPANGALASSAPSKSGVQVTINNSVTTGNSTYTKSKEEICKEKVKEFSVKLNDLSSDDKIKAVVKEAMKTPFDNQCGQLHYDVLYTFSRFKISPDEYKSFLLNTLDTIAYPTQDDRTYSIIRFLSSDGLIDNQEWQAAFHAVSRVGNYSLSTYLSYLLTKSSGQDKQVVHQRIDSYFSLANNGKLGLPRPVTYEMAFSEMMEGVKDDPELGEYVYATYAAKLHLTERTMADIFKDLQSLYKSETNLQLKSKIATWIAEFTKAHDYEKADEQLYDFALSFMPNRYKNEIDPDLNKQDLTILVSLCGNKFADYATRTEYPNQKEDRINFCVLNAIPIPGVIPTLEEAATVLSGTNLDEQLRIMKLLELMDDRPRKIEASLVALLSKRTLDDRQKLSEIQTIDINILGNIKTTNKSAIDYMIATLPHYGNDTEASEVALVKIGKPAVSALISRLDKTTDQDGGLQFQLISMLGKIGKEAASAERSIQRVLKLNNNSDVQYAGEAALQAIK